MLAMAHVGSHYTASPDRVGQYCALRVARCASSTNPPGRSRQAACDPGRILALSPSQASSPDSSKDPPLLSFFRCSTPRARCSVARALPLHERRAISILAARTSMAGFSAAASLRRSWCSLCAPGRLARCRCSSLFLFPGRLLKMGCRRMREAFRRRIMRIGGGVR